MDRENETLLETFDEHTLPDLHTVVLGALEHFSHEALPSFEWEGGRTLVLGSAGAAATGKMLFPNTVQYADESTYRDALATGTYDRAVIISASGGKHAVEMAAACEEAVLETWLVTNNPAAPARAHLKEENVRVFPRNREPYTYNTSTYLGMVLSRTGEDAVRIHSFIEEQVAPQLPDTLGTWSAFCLIVPAQFAAVVPLLRIKFEELFGGRVCGRVFTDEEIKHAKTVVPSETECFISFGEENTVFGTREQRVQVPLPDDAGHAAMMAIGYYLVGRIQEAHPPYFKEHIGAYVETASELFGETISVIVE
jgi:hypothetical protein